MIQPGQIDYQKQLDSLKDLPANQQSIEYLTGLARNPGSPFVRFLVESRLEQLTKALQNQAGQQAQEAAPQGTISDKIQQAAGLAALQAGQQRQAAQQMQEQASRAQMPVPQGIAQPQAQPEADSGIASAPVDSEMFNFAPGGIVAFNGEKDSVVKHKPELSKEESDDILRRMEERLGLRPRQAIEVPPVDNNIPGFVAEEPTLGMSSGPARVNPLSRMLLDPLKAAASGISGLISRPAPQSMMLDSSEAPAASPVAAPAAPTSGIKTIRPEILAMGQAPMPGPNANPNAPAMGDRRNMDQIMAEQAAKQAAKQAAAKPRPAAPVAPTAPAAPAAPTGIAATLAALQNMPQQTAFNKSIEDMRKGTEGTTRKQKIDDELDLQKTLGIGTFEKQQQQMYEDNKARQAKIDAGRGQRDFLAQLAAYSRPGANWSQVAERDIANKSAAMMEDQRFADSQNKLLTDIQRTSEERRIGTASSVRAAELAEKKSKQEALHYIMQAQGVNMQVAEKILGDTLNAQVQTRGQDVQARGQDMQYKVGMANAAANATSKSERLDLEREKARMRFDQNVKQMEARNQDLLNKNVDYKGWVKMRQGLEQNLNYLTDETKRAKTLEQIDGYNQKIADLSIKIIGGGGISTLPQSTPGAGTKVIDFSKIK